MKKNLYYLFFIFLSPVLTSGQSTFVKGYVVTNSGDTLYGKIKDRTTSPFATLYKKIRFKGNSPFRKKFGPDRIIQYQRGDTTYESVWLRTTSEFLKINYQSTPGIGKKHFLKLRVKGKLTYYDWEQLDPESDTILEIPLFKRENENYLIRVTQGILGLKKENLRRYFKGYPEVVEKIESKQLKTPKEIAIFYNNLVNNNGYSD